MTEKLIAFVVWLISCHKRVAIVVLVILDLHFLDVIVGIYFMLNFLNIAYEFHHSLNFHVQGLFLWIVVVHLSLSIRIQMVQIHIVQDIILVSYLVPPTILPSVNPPYFWHISLNDIKSYLGKFMISEYSASLEEILKTISG